MFIFMKKNSNFAVLKKTGKLLKQGQSIKKHLTGPIYKTFEVLRRLVIINTRRRWLQKTKQSMKKDIHPKDYRFVVFKDMSNDYAFLTRSTAITKETIVWEDGKEYPLIKLEISHTSHPFYTGKQQLVDTAGRVDKFRTKYQKHLKQK